MIDQSTYTRDWVNYVSTNYGHGRKKANPMLIEKVTKALHLLELLMETNLNFIFKSGTSLLLLLDKMYRFSIDIDIIVDDDKSNIDMKSMLDQVVSNSSVFLRFEANDRVNTMHIPKAHYKLFYNSVMDGAEGYVLLDILFEKNNYPKIYGGLYDSIKILSILISREKCKRHQPISISVFYQVVLNYMIITYLIVFLLIT